jgi:GNAT superfamily N-acetyltransferase
VTATSSNGDTITIRPFASDDALAVAAALVDSSIHHTALEPERYEPLDADVVAQVYRAGRQHPGDKPPDERATLVAELNGEVVGVLDVHVVYPGGSHRKDRYGYIAEVAVRAPLRRRGVGAALLRAAEEWARRAGCAWTVLDYNARNIDAGRFYAERMGYRPAGVIVVKDLRAAESRADVSTDESSN